MNEQEIRHKLSITVIDFYYHKKMMEYNNIKIKEYKKRLNLKIK